MLDDNQLPLTSNNGCMLLTPRSKKAYFVIQFTLLRGCSMKYFLFISALLFSVSANSASIRTAVVLNGLQWAQITDTAHLTLEDIYNVCGISGQVCSGQIKNTDLSGWSWANQTQTSELMSSFFGFEYHQGQTYNIDTSLWFEYFDFTGGEANTIYTLGASSNVLTLLDGELVVDEEEFVTNIIWDWYSEMGYIGEYNAFSYLPYIESFYPTGFYLYKDEKIPPIGSAVPLPASIFFLTPALFGFMVIRRKTNLYNVT